MIKVRVTYAYAFNLPNEEIELKTGSFIELKEKIKQKLETNALSFASSGNLILDPETILTDNQEIFVFPSIVGG